MDPIDTSAEWDHLYPAASPPTAEEARLRAIKICAVRETFEECGILLSESTTSTAKDVWDKVPEQERMIWRDKVRGALWFLAAEDQQLKTCTMLPGPLERDSLSGSVQDDFVQG